MGGTDVSLLYHAEYCSMIPFIKDIDWSLVCCNSLFAEVVLHSCIAQFVPCHYWNCKIFSFPKHIRHLLALKKVWYCKDKVRYKYLTKLYGEGRILGISSCLRN